MLCRYNIFNVKHNMIVSKIKIWLESETYLGILRPVQLFIQHISHFSNYLLEYDHY